MSGAGVACDDALGTASNILYWPPGHPAPKKRGQPSTTNQGDAPEVNPSGDVSTTPGCSAATVADILDKPALENAGMHRDNARSTASTPLNS